MQCEWLLFFLPSGQQAPLPIPVFSVDLHQFLIDGHLNLRKKSANFSFLLDVAAILDSVWAARKIQFKFFMGSSSAGGRHCLSSQFSPQNSRNLAENSGFFCCGLQAKLQV
jgi:hypothetical protein